MYWVFWVIKFKLSQFVHWHFTFGALCFLFHWMSLTMYYDVVLYAYFIIMIIYIHITLAVDNCCFQFRLRVFLLSSIVGYLYCFLNCIHLLYLSDCDLCYTCCIVWLCVDSIFCQLFHMLQWVPMYIVYVTYILTVSIRHSYSVLSTLHHIIHSKYVVSIPLL